VLSRRDRPSQRGVLSRRGVLQGASAALALSACGGDRGSPFWFSFGGKPREVLLAIIADFHASQREHRIQPVYQGDYFETLAKLRTSLHVGMAPALVHVVGESLPYLVDAGVLEPIDDVAAGLDLVPELTQRGMFPSGPQATFALPFNRSTPIAYFNEEIFAREGAKPPETWDELRGLARALTRGEEADKRFGFACAIDWWFWIALVGQAGGSLFDDAGRPAIASEEATQAIELWRELVTSGVMRPPPGRDYNAWQVVNADFVEQRAAMIWTSTAYLRYFDEHARFAFKTAPLPRLARRSVPTGGTFFVAPKGAREEDRRATRAFLAFAMQPAQANRFALETGYIPVSKTGLGELEAKGWYADHPNDRVAIDQLADARGWPWSTSLLRVQREIVQPRLEAAILADRPAREVLDEAQRAALEDG
jgi:sn-glycerol 3-phosphate transport system substrate-binding protein